MEQHHFVRTCAYFTAARYMRSVEMAADRIFAPTGMKPAYSYIMMTLQDSHPMTIRALCEALGYERSTLSRMVHMLADQQLVTLSTRGRAVLIELGPLSEAFLVKANECLAAFASFTDLALGEDKPRVAAVLNSANQRLREHAE
ncbi:MAG: MarR family transcriptional regulator [Bifidobacterium psychraerophilum]|uniref:MarR family winged helix-turn-helix transcriptional regulator n=1 Tax=Bifidobacterium psychraerophilum TaxID=218140 RepID=UPI0039ECA3B4